MRLIIGPIICHLRIFAFKKLPASYISFQSPYPNISSTSFTTTFLPGLFPSPFPSSLFPPSLCRVREEIITAPI